MSSTDWKKPAIASRPLYSVGSPNVARYGSSKAASSANISAAFLGSLNEKAVYSSMSSLAFFIDHRLVRTVYSVPGTLACKQARPALHHGLSLSALFLGGDPHGFVKQIHDEELEDSDKEGPSAFPRIVLIQPQFRHPQLHGAGERAQKHRRRRRRVHRQ